MSCYALFQGWLLLSQLWLSGLPHILVTLSGAGGTLAVGSGLFPSRPRTFSPVVSLIPYIQCQVFGSLVEIGRTPVPLIHPVALPPTLSNIRGCTSMHFGENQLSPYSISFSLLSTGHPRLFQQALVRSSTSFHRGFNLPMDRSYGFGSTIRDYFALFRLGFPPAPDLKALNLATYRNSPAHSSIGTPPSGTQLHTLSPLPPIYRHIPMPVTSCR